MAWNVTYVNDWNEDLMVPTNPGKGNFYTRGFGICGAFLGVWAMNELLEVCILMFMKWKWVNEFVDDLIIVFKSAQYI